MKKFLALVSALLLMILAVVPATNACAEAGGTVMYVSSANGKGVRMRDIASTDGRILYNLGEGTKVTVYSIVDGGWAYVSAEGHIKKGYVMVKFLSSTEPVSVGQSFKAVTPYTVTVRPACSTGYVNLRSAASRSSACLRRMNRGTRLTVTAENGSWFRVVDANGNTGYVARAYTSC